MADHSPFDAPKVAYIAASLEQAHIVRNALEERGIRAQVTNVALQFGVGELPLGTPTAARVLVSGQDLAAARQIVERFDSGRDGIEADDRLGDDGEDEEDEASLTDANWPRCPSCGRGRHTSCPHCGTAGNRFPRAYFPPGTVDRESAAAEGINVICEICDEPFTARFPARCEWCGYRFTDGQEAPTPPPFADEMNWRVWLVLAGLVAIGAAVLAWGWYIAPRS